ncbi:MAG: class I SAM-dependent RNA methyltransferase [Lachnospiraceae bacterium]|nr:class I SAM-dependent RNA methyltransferase [Lachnospiraceae bacterium]
MNMKITLPCHFGMEAVLKRELRDLGYEPYEVTDGRVSVMGDARAVCDINIRITTAERVLIDMGEFSAATFEELYQGIRGIAWEEYLPGDARFWVTKAGSTDSKLTAIPSIQAVAKKAMVERMGAHYGMNVFPEDGDSYPVRIFLRKDMASVYLDTSGAPLHKRGYRARTAAAPIAETLAQAIILLSPWHPDRILMDPFCGSGTFAIEAAMRAAKIAPGLKREFTAEKWQMVTPQRLWDLCRHEAKERVDRSVKTQIFGSDIDPAMIRTARANATEAGVAELITFENKPVSKISSAESYGFIITNPPYGERLSNDDTLPGIYKDLGESFSRLKEWSMYMISGYEQAEKYINRKATKKRKLYNGMLRTTLYQYMGAKPSGNKPDYKKEEIR